MNLKDLQCRKCANCTDITLVTFPKCTPYIYIECPKISKGYVINPAGINPLYLYCPSMYECREFIPKEVPE